jgi:tubulin polyglutamylase complex subunit 2
MSSSSKRSSPIVERSGVSNDVVNFLRGHEGITGIDFVQSVGVQPNDIKLFENRESIQLPEDYKSFLLTSDGFKLKWSVSFRTKIYPLGLLTLNKLADVRKVPTVINDEYRRPETLTSPLETPLPSQLTSNDHVGIVTKLVHGRRIRMMHMLPVYVNAFEIDTSENTRVALLYGIHNMGATSLIKKDVKGNNNPQVWYQDHSGRWFFIAHSFIDYFRLMVTHLGLPDWQSAYTDVGLDPTSMQWFTYLTNSTSRSSPSSTGLSLTQKKGRSAHSGDGLLFGAFTAKNENVSTKGLATLRNVTGHADDMTSPVLLREQTIISTSNGVRNSNGNGRASNGRRLSSGNASSWFDVGSGTRKNHQRPGSAPMRRGVRRSGSRR